MFRLLVAAPLSITLLAASLAAAQPPRPTPASAVTLTLPAPTGNLPIGVTERHLIDASRADPFRPEQRREVMISIWYPAATGAQGPRAPYMTPAAGRIFSEAQLRPLGIDPARFDPSAIQTAAIHNAAPRRGRFPLVLYSPGGGLPRALGTTLVQDLASRGYVVVTMDHTHDSQVIEFPGGRLVRAAPPMGDELRGALLGRVGDARFVLSELERQRRTPLGRMMDLSRVGMFGHSAGGFTAFEAASLDPRLDAVINMDGSLGYGVANKWRGGVVAKGLDRPFMILGAGLSGQPPKPHHHLDAAEWADMWRASSGWKRDFYIAESEHMAFADNVALLPQMAANLTLPRGLIEQGFGKADPSQQVAAQRALVAAFFDQHLKGKKRALLDAATPFPIVQRVG